MPVPILKQGHVLIASVQDAITDADLITLKNSLAELLNVQFAILFALVAFGWGILLWVASLALEEFSYHRYHRWRDLAIAIAAAILENVGYRQLHAVWRLRGLSDALRDKDVAWGTMTRTGFATAPSPD